jgi:hypothetical protein
VSEIFTSCKSRGMDNIETNKISEESIQEEEYPVRNI